jgi:outer membrane protein, heavy metal efflux system
VRLRYVLVVFTLLGPRVAPSAHAQQPPRRLTIAEALNIAEKQNLDLQAARARQAVSQAGVRAAGQRPNPIGNVSVSRDAPHEGVLIDQPVEIGPKRNRRIEVAQQEGALTETDITAVEKLVRHRVRDRYFQLAHARGVTAQQAEALALAQRLYSIAQDRFNAGDVAQLEVTQAQLEVARAQADLEVAQQEEKVMLSELNSVLNESPQTDWDLGNALTLPTLTRPLPDLLTRAGNSNAEIARISQEAKLEQSRTELLRADRIPDLILEFGVDLNDPGYGPHSGGYIVGPRGGLAMELPLFSRNQGEIAASIASEHAIEGELAAARRNLESNVASAYFDLQARQTEVRVYHDTILPSSHTFEDLAEQSYRAGKANLLVVLTAQRDVQQVEREYLDSLLELQTAFGQLEEAVGGPLD